MSDTIEHKGLTFRVSIEADDSGGAAPWIEYDGHGEVRHVRYFHGKRSIGKKPGECVLYAARRDAWLYDFAGAMPAAPGDIYCAACRSGLNDPW